MQQWFSRSGNTRVCASGLWACPGTHSWCCMSSAFWMPVSALPLGPLLLVRDVAHVAHVVSKCGSGTMHVGCVFAVLFQL